MTQSTGIRRDGHRPRLLDAFCCQGGAGMGYYRAGFEVTGVDVTAQPRYPLGFHQGDAIEFIRTFGASFDFVHASPPCQFDSDCQRIQGNTLPQPPHPAHTAPQAKMGRPVPPGHYGQYVGNFSGVPLARQVMDVPWMNRDGIRECIPPAYTHWIAVKYLTHERRAVA
ncbi:SAM-dependent methyltransferase [Streptomyces syringium]|uniref:SAM-dependent methyltransferase n=1 Tax=Streptomyces syringium TaxID=76729 RepID=UPI0034429DF7